MEVDKVVPVQNQVDSDSGQLTITRQDLENLINLAPEGSDIFSSVTGEFTGVLPTYPADRVLANHVAANAQGRATAILLAEYTLAQQYISNPHLLDPSFRAQLDDV